MKQRINWCVMIWLALSFQLSINIIFSHWIPDTSLHDWKTEPFRIFHVQQSSALHYVSSLIWIMPHGVTVIGKSATIIGKSIHFSNYKATTHSLKNNSTQQVPENAVFTEYSAPPPSVFYARVFSTRFHNETIFERCKYPVAGWYSLWQNTTCIDRFFEQPLCYFFSAQCWSFKCGIMIERNPADYVVLLLYLSLTSFLLGAIRTIDGC